MRYRCAAEPIATYVCHCRQCQKQSGSAFGISAIVPRDSLQLLEGEIATFDRTTDSGGVLTCAFCPACGSRIWHCRSLSPNKLSVKAGTFDVPVSLASAVHIWTATRLGGVIIPDGAVWFPGEPPD
ncbi:MAG: GFA family protein [Pseudomonadota bacterium]